MNATRQRVLALLAASSLSGFASACGGSDPEPQTEQQTADATSGGEAEQACGGGACGSVGSQEPQADGPTEEDTH